jgi:alanine racemase
MKSLLRWLSRRRFPYEPLITVEISRGRLIHNLNEFRKLAPKAMVAPVLKSNAYGHGLLEIASLLKDEHVPFFIVDSYFEAVSLRSQRVRTPILIIGYTRPETIAHSRLRDTAFTIASMETLRLFTGKKPPSPEEHDSDGHDPRSISTGRIVRIHLKIDTGMRRQGILPEEADEAIEIIEGNRQLSLEGICTHLCDADNPDTSFTDSQIHIWNRMAKKFRTAFPSLKYVHASATDGHEFAEEIDANVSRLGIGLYGLSENKAITSKLGLQPVLKMKTIITGVKKLKPGESVGYGNTFRAEKEMLIATIPVGYFEGLDRRLSNNGSVQVGPNKTVCPIIGRVSMNITTIDVSGLPHAKTGDEVTVVSDISTDPNSIESIEKRMGSITYEMAVRIPAHLKRTVL